MCGIAGCFGKRDEKTVNRMLDALGHRGPNDRGVHTLGNTVLGHTRLSIVDVATGGQPIMTRDKQKAVISNGEIYNFKKLRASLQPEHRFRTKSDAIMA